MKNDAISRQAAIRWVKTECNPYGKPTLDFESGKKVIEHLEQMPAAEPQITRCKDCKHYDELDKTCGWCKFHSRTAYAHRFCSEAKKKEAAEPQSKPTKEGRCMIMDGYQTEKYIESLISNKETYPTKMTGWTCPVCGRGLSPFTSVCPCKGWKGLEITCQTKVPLIEGSKSAQNES